MNGTDLKVKRIKAHIQGQTLAALLRERHPAERWSPSKVSRIEARAHVDPELAAQYVAALATLTTNATDAA